MKVYLMKLVTFKSKDNKILYKFLGYSSYGFTFELFTDKELAEYYDAIISETGFADVTNDVELRYNKKADKLEYYLKK